MAPGAREKAANGAANPKARLGTFQGVFIPTSLNIFSILVFLRFGFILGQSGVIGFFGMLVICYVVDLLTTASLSAIATNGTVRGGGAYYLISRSLGPEFGGAIGVVYYLGCVFNTGLNAVGLIECLVYNFGINDGLWLNWLPDGFWWSYLWSTIVLISCALTCLAGSRIFSKASNVLLVVVFLATLSIPLSGLFVRPFQSEKHRIVYTGPSLNTLRENLYPGLTKGADGSKQNHRETWQDLFGVLFPATTGIFAYAKSELSNNANSSSGSSMSGDLKHPGKAIPKGTFFSLLFTFVTYTLVILSLASTVSRQSFYKNVNVVQDINMSGYVILLGEFAVTFFGALMGVIGPAKLLQALARDHLIPGLSILGMGSGDSDEPHFAILITYIIAQVTMLFDINQIASFVTMSFLMTFLVTNLACFLLKIGSAPNFRPSFRYFTWESAAIGAVMSWAIMMYVDKVYASACVALLIAVFVVIHYTSPPKSWGDVSQTLIYHQVRKYLLRLRQDHVKFWRPSVLLFVNDPRKKYKLIQFCNSLKKGALFILGHVIITDDFKAATPEVKRQQNSWSRYIDVMKIKAFINIAVSPTVDWGLRNVVLNSGLGGMRPNIVILGFFNMSDLRRRELLVDVPDPRHHEQSSDQETPTRGLSSWLPTSKLGGRLPTDSNRKEAAIDAKSYVTTLEDLVYNIRINVAIAKGFESLELPGPAPSLSQKLQHLLWRHRKPSAKPKYIDLWPIQMSTYSQIREDGKQKRGVLTTNFDTYTMILQLGAILTTVNSYQRSYSLRVSVFVEYENDVEEERTRILSLLANLRIKADVRVFWLANGDVKTYEVIVNGKTSGDFSQAAKLVDEALRDEPWWQEVADVRTEEASAIHDLSQLENSPSLDWRRESFRMARPRELSEISVKALKRMLKKGKRASMGRLKSFHPEMRVQLSRLDPDLIAHNHAYDSPSESSSSDSGDSTDHDSDAGIGAGSESSRGRLGSPSSSRLRRGQKSMSSKSLSAAALAHSKTRLFDTTVQGTSSSGKGTNTPRSIGSPRKPPAIRHQSMPKFTSRPMPRTKIAAEEREGGSHSIMFDEPIAVDASDEAVAGAAFAQDYHDDEAETLAASGFPRQQALALSFNDLPSRAQHLVLNELMVASSADAGVVFTTLPGPAEGTGASEPDSVRYLSDLEVLCADLPPVLLVHSNAVTVTVSL